MLGPKGLAEIVGAANVLVDPDLTARYRTDWTGRFVADRALVVRPGSAAEVAAVVAACRAEGVAVVAQGGNTGLVGGGIALDGEVVLSAERLAGVEVTGPAALVAGAGATVDAIQRTARGLGLRYGVDLASRASATIGGTVATDAGGTRVLRHGQTRRQVTGVELVTGTGAVISTIGRPARDNTGYDLTGLACGSEGTLGVLTRVEVRLVPAPAHAVVALLRFDDPAAALRAAEHVPARLPSAEAVEVFVDAGLRLVCSTFALPTPFPTVDGGYLLIEASGDDPPDRLTDALAAVAGDLDGVADVAVATSAADRDRLWRYREAHTEAIARLGPAHKLDVAVPTGSLAALAAAVPAAVAVVAPEATAWLFGHGGESTIHVNVTGAPADDERVDEAVLRLVADLGGSISAEHGIGRAKRRWLDLARDSASIAAFEAIKAAFDPDGILNPAVLVAPRPARPFAAADRPAR